ncbi:acyltransferase family protein [Actinomycetospora rhizophila]|uniref:Acyltransferase family protein n=1 Tax=Actinomycetospora rhizophila TaxID=1416876 RepID=A0ABV9ZK06_9PSEU
MTSTADRDAARVPRAAPSGLPATGTPAPSPAPTRDRFRPEIEGLRALASLLVVVYHVWIGRVSGGVDVFFVLTGFLAVGQLLRASERGHIDLVAQWGRTLRRLVPPAVVVLAGTVVASLLFLPESRWSQTLVEVVTSATFTENWKLAADSVDYYAAHDSASVVQHFWSLSIQGQFALVFPVLVVVAVLLARHRGAGVRSTVAAVLVAVTALSFAYSLWLTAADQQLAYFHSLTRVWEFTLGALLALVIDRIDLPVHLRVVLGWVGVVGLVSCGVALDVEGGFPGYLAGWPVLCAVAVLVAGSTGHALSADRHLTARPLQYLGSISFPLYLWHWPVLLLALQVTHKTAPGWALGSAVIATSIALAAGTRALVERPLAASRVGRGSRWGNYRLAAVTLVPLVVIVLVWHGVTTVRAQPDGTPGDADHPGATSRQAGFVYRGSPDASLLPPAVSSYDDWVYYKDGGDCRWLPYPVLEECTFVGAADPNAPTIVVVGDSHMQQFLPAVAPVARERGWRVTTLIRGNCPFSTGSETVADQGCADTNQAAIAHIARTRPALVVADASRNVRVGLTESTPPGFVEAWGRLGDAGVPVLAVRDNPRFDTAPPSCVDTYGRGAAECLVPRADIYRPQLSIPDAPPNTTVVDLSDSICDPHWCPPEIGNILVYLDNNHLTASFSATLAPVVGPRIAAVIDR